MPCYRIGKTTICRNNTARLRLNTGRYVFAEFPAWEPPCVYHDRALSREIDRWFLDEDITTAVKWFENRGRKG